MIEEDKKEEKVGIIKGITDLLEMGYKFFRMDGRGNYVVHGKRVKPNGPGWSKSRKQEIDSKDLDRTILEPVEIIIDDSLFTRIQNQYTEVLTYVRAISYNENADSQTYKTLFENITILKEMISNNTEQLEVENKLEAGQSILKVIESAEEIIQRHYLTGKGDCGYIRERRALLVEQTRKEAIALRQKKLSEGEYQDDTAGWILSARYDAENR